MNEDFLYYLWQHYIPGSTLKGCNNEKIFIQKPGTRNLQDGPDFHNSIIRIENTLWAGNVEIHVKASDWYRHHHQNDKLYNNIILHVVYENDKPVSRQNGELIPTLALKGQFDNRLWETYRSFLRSKHWIPCEKQIERVEHFTLMNWLYRLSVERLEKKATSIFDMLSQCQNNFIEVFYRQLLQNYGFKTNSEPFLQLALSLPYSILSKHKNSLLQIEALLFGQAGMLSRDFTDNYPKLLQNEYDFLSKKYHLTPLKPETWQFMRLHPANFPTIRIAQFAHLFYHSSSLLHKILESERLSDVVQLLGTEASGYWQNHYIFEQSSINRPKKLGKSSLYLILINTIVPFLFVYGKLNQQQQQSDKALDWLSQIPAEKNTITRHFIQIGIKPKNALQSQALIELKNSYCKKKRCLQCQIGHVLLKSG